jgi:hypothetical protein
MQASALAGALSTKGAAARYCLWTPLAVGCRLLLLFDRSVCVQAAEA